MPLYYFSIEDGERIPPDDGHEFPNDDAARKHAERISRELSKKYPGGANWLISVTDEAGREIAAVPTSWVEL